MVIQCQAVSNIIKGDDIIKKKIEGFDYYISENGDIFNLKGHKICQWIDNVGYKQVKLFKDAKKYYKRVHRLVYQYFVGDIPDGMQINHKDGNKKNNHFSNLELATNSENTKHGYDNGLYHSKHRQIQVEVYTKDWVYIKTCESIRQTAAEFNVNRKTLSAILFDGKANNYNYNFKAILDAEGQTTIESIAA